MDIEDTHDEKTVLLSSSESRKSSKGLLENGSHQDTSYQAMDIENSQASIHELQLARKRLDSHRLSYTDIVERITLTWHEISVWVPPTKSKLIGSKSSDDAYIPKQILHGGKLSSSFHHL